MSGNKKSKGGSVRKNPGLYTLAGTVVTTLGVIATHETTALVLPLIVIAAILFVFTLVLWYQRFQDHSGSKPSTAPARLLCAKDLHPEQLAKRLDAEQRRNITILLEGLVGDVAGEVGMQSKFLRTNLFSCFPESNQLGMVRDLWRNMDGGEECTIRISIGEGSTGIAWATGNSNKVIRNGDWGESQLGDAAELAKVHPDLKWILTVPIFGSTGGTTKLALNVDGLRLPSGVHNLDAAMGHLPRFGHGISVVLGL